MRAAVLLAIVLGTAVALVPPVRGPARATRRFASKLSNDPDDALKIQEIIVKSHESKLAAIQEAKAAAASEVAQKLAELEAQLKEVEKKHAAALDAQKKEFEALLDSVEAPKAAAKPAPKKANGVKKAEAAPVAKATGTTKTFPAGKPQPDYEKVVTTGAPTMTVAPGEVHPKYLSRVNSGVFSERWGEEEIEKMADAPKAAAAPAAPKAKAAGKPTLPAGKPQPNYEKTVTVGKPTEVAPVGQEHPKYRSRAQTESFKERWGPEEQAKMAEAPKAEAAAPKAAAPKAAPAKEAFPAAAAPAPAAANPGFMQKYLVEAHTTKLELQNEVVALTKRADAAEDKALAGQEFMKKYVVEAQIAKSELLERATAAEKKVEELETLVENYQDKMKELLVKQLEAKLEAVEQAKAEALAAYATRLAEIQKSLNDK
uniref:Uncharacterized protein n=1 Tax=Phaeomonas parva TaxID=124430 RepID=A0A7S1XQG1_9STRA|mmetsp:Transcript_25285/g.79369  ORF Transcript_25285/g.79369 Transcript_25285/m.79369 type:complete len:429 (+) Transcript_25285:91-1377(+)